MSNILEDEGKYGATIHADKLLGYSKSQKQYKMTPVSNRVLLKDFEFIKNSQYKRTRQGFPDLSRQQKRLIRIHKVNNKK